MNNYIVSIINFKTIYEFLLNQYFFKIAFESIYLSKSKTHLFANNLKLLKFENNIKRIRFSIKYREKIRN